MWKTRRNNLPNAARRMQLLENNSLNTTRRIQPSNATRRKQLAEGNSPNAIRRKQLAVTNCQNQLADDVKGRKTISSIVTRCNDVYYLDYRLPNGC